MPDMSGLPIEGFPGNRDTGNSAPKVFESSISGDSLQQLRAILSAKDIRVIQGSYSPRGEGSVYHSEKIAASILRDDGVQNFAFPDTAARQPYDVALRPLLQWLSTTEKHKGGAIKGATANNCAPDAPKAAPMQFSPATAKTISVTDSRTAGKPVVKQDQDSVPTVKVDVNLVLVPVVVRDSQGRGIGTLRQEDFRLLDNGKPRTISRFSLEQAGGLVSAAPSASGEISGTSNSSATAAKVGRTVAYLFDDIHISPTDWNQVRSAADRHLSALPPGVQAGIFTTSGQITLDFTADTAKLHESLLRIQPHQVSSSGGADCPHIDTYLADLILNHHDEFATTAVTADALNCAFGNDLRAAAAAEAMAKTTARQQLASAGAQGRIFLGSLQTALRRLAARPGRRAVVLVSPGFLAPGLEQLFNQLIDYALRSEIMVNTLDVRGLYTAESGQRYERESAIENGEILATLASATGGTSFQNNNDLIAGFDRVAAPPGYCYVLGFSPPNQELDGRFHNLAVSVNNGQKLTVQARKGYYAADRSPKPRTGESAQ
jgi:VWFA-related protein